MKKVKTKKLENCPCFDGQNEDNPCFDGQNEGKNFRNQGMMKCMKGAKWFLLIPGVIIILAFLLGYILDPAAVKILWLIITGTLIILGTIFYILMNIWVNKLQRNSAH